MAHIHWYPGHIAKAEKQLKEQINLVDVVIEILDARIPWSSRYPNIEQLIGQKPRLILLNKADTCDLELTKQWQSKIKAETNCPVLLTCAHNSKDINAIVSKAIELSEPAIQKLMAKGLLRRPARAMIVGLPNVGKSSIINKLIKKQKTKTGAKAGVTRQQQWVRINPKLDFLDTPGIIPLKLDDQVKATKLAFVSGVSENAYDAQEVAKNLLEILQVNYLDELREYYKLDNEISLETLAISRNWLIKGEEPDTLRAATYVLSDFRNTRIGKFTLDEID